MQYIIGTSTCIKCCNAIMSHMYELHTLYKAYNWNSSSVLVRLLSLTEKYFPFHQTQEEILKPVRSTDLCSMIQI